MSMDEYLSEIQETRLLSAEDERVLGERVMAGDLEARDEMVRANLRMVVHTARSYVGRGVPIEDLVGQGNLGLMRGVEGYDPESGMRLATYATPWIRDAITKYLAKEGRHVRVPKGAITLALAWRSAARSILDARGYPATPDEIRTTLDLSALQSSIAQAGLKILEMARANENDGERSTWNLKDDASDTGPAEVMAKAEELSNLRLAIDGLNEREAEVIRLRFGFGGGEPMSLREAAAVLGTGKGTIQKIERIALSRLADKLGSP